MTLSPCREGIIAPAARAITIIEWLRMHLFPNEPAYVTLANRTFYDGLRKAGLL